MPVLTDPIRIGQVSLRNRLYRAPVLEGAGKAKDPAKAYAKHFVRNAETGVGLIIQGNTIVTPEGRTSPGMTAVRTAEDLHALRPMTEAVHAAGAAIAIQLGHGGIYAIEGWHEPYVSERTQPPLAPSPPPAWLRLTHRHLHVPDTREVEALVARFGVVAKWAKEAGYDAVQLAAGNAKLLHQFLSPTYNRRTDRFGGSVRGRAQILVEIRDAIAKTCGPDFGVWLKLCALEPKGVGPGISLEEGVATAKIAADAGFAQITPASSSALPNTALCRGGYPGKSFDNKRLWRDLQQAGGRVGAWGVRAQMWLAARKYPFAPVWNRAVFAAVKHAVDVPVFAVGGIRTPAEANGILAAGQADLIGVGRPFYTEPALAEWFLAEEPGRTPRCENCNRCVVPQMLGMPGVCYNPASQG